MSACRVLAVALLLAGAATAAAAGQPAARKSDHDSLLFSSTALAQIEAARRGEGRLPQPDGTAASAARAPAAMPATIHLSAIVYHAPDDWRIWLNGQSFTPAATPGALEILAVTADTVRLAWRGAPARRFELQPNQSYLAASGRVVEGRVALRGARR
jgi:hypothetical protein